MSGFQIYCDESGFCDKRFQSICAVSGNANELMVLRDSLTNILSDNKVTDLKFLKIRTHRPKIKTAQEFLNKAVEFVLKGCGRIDTLIWDMRDERHNVFGRDAVANFHRMFYHLITDIVRRYKHSSWEVYPDENTAFDWDDIGYYLNNTRRDRWNPLLIKIFNEFNSFFHFELINPVSSADEPLVQLADLFAGMGRFSYSDTGDYKFWKSNRETNQESLFPSVSDQRISKASKSRFEIMYEFSEKCKLHRLGVSLNTYDCFKTPNPGNPINFWLYERQHDTDFAPVKS